MPVITPPINFTENTEDGTGATINTVLSPLNLNTLTSTLSISEASASARGIVGVGTQSFAGVKTFATGVKCSVTPTAAADLANKAYVDTLVSSGLSWKNTIISFRAMQTNPPVSPSNGDRYISTETAGSFIINYIYEYSSTLLGWIETIPQEGNAIYDKNTDKTYVYTQANVWTNIGVSIDHTNLLNIGTLTHAQIDSKFIGTTNSTSSSTGALTIAGGAGIAKSIAIGGDVIIDNNTSKINFVNGSSKKGVVLYDAAPTNNYQFIGIGTAANELRSQLSATGNHYSIVSAINSTSEQEVMRVEGDLASSVSIKHTMQSSSTTTGALLVSGGAAVAKNLYVGGNDVVSGTLNVNSTLGTTSTTTGALLVSGGAAFGNSICVGNNVRMDNSSSKIYFTSGSGKKAVVLYDADPTNNYQFLGLGAAAFEIRTQLSDTSNHYSIVSAINPTTEQEVMRIEGDLASSVSIKHTMQSSSTTTGALLVSGGAAVAKNLYVGGNEVVSGTLNSGAITATTLSLTATTDSTSISTGSLVSSGGLGIAKKTHLGDVLTIHNVSDASKYGTISADTSGNMILNSTNASSLINDTTDSSSTSTGAFIVSGGVGIAKKLYVGNNTSIGGNMTSSNIIASSTTAATDTATGSLRLAGGAGIAGSVYVGGNEVVSGTVAINSTLGTTSSTTGALIVAGGIGIGNSICTNGNMRIDNPTAKIYYSSNAPKKAFVLYEAAANDYQFLGMGMAANEMRSQLSATGNHYSFYSAINPSSEQELMRIEGDLASSVSIKHTMQSSSTTTGALLVSGGAAIAKNLYVGGTIYSGSQSFTSCSITGTTESTSTTTGSLTVAGGVGIAKKLYIGGTVDLQGSGNTLGFNNANAGLIYGSGTLTIYNDSGSIYTGLDSSVNVLNTIESSSVTTGSFIVNGGVGINKNLYVGNLLTTALGKVTSTLDSTSSTTGSLIISGGASIQKNLYLNGLNVDYNVSNVTVNWLGATLSISGTLKCRRIAGIAFITFDQSFGSLSSSDYIYCNDIIPTGYRPLVSTSDFIIGIKDTNYENGLARISSNGTIYIAKEGFSVFSAADSTSIGFGFSISYPIV